MKILLFTYGIIPQFAKAFNSKSSSVGGGWIVGILNSLRKAEIDVSIISPFGKTLEKRINDNITFCAIPKYKNGLLNIPSIHNELEYIINTEKPNVIMIFGTEFAQNLAMLEVCKKLNYLEHTVIFIQGLLKGIARSYTADLPYSIIKHRSIREIFSHQSIKEQQEQFYKRAIFEEQMLKIVKHVIVGTIWDKTLISSMNPNIHFHNCNEILRDGFYNHEQWTHENCEKHSILSIQSSLYPLKGMHYLIEGLFFIKKKYPDTKLYVTLKTPRIAKTILQKLFMHTYENYIGELIEKYNLEKNIIFLGSLNEQQLIERMLKSNIIISASSIENHSQTVGEAKILGIPVISSFVGGVVERIKHGEDGYLYQHDAPYMISEYVNRIFSDNELAKRISGNAKISADILLNKEKNTKILINELVKIAK